MLRQMRHDSAMVDVLQSQSPHERLHGRRLNLLALNTQAERAYILFSNNNY
jgi:hypothetical protein